MMKNIKTVATEHSCPQAGPSEHGVLLSVGPGDRRDRTHGHSFQPTHLPA